MRQFLEHLFIKTFFHSSCLPSPNKWVSCLYLSGLRDQGRTSHPIWNACSSLHLVNSYLYFSLQPCYHFLTKSFPYTYLILGMYRILSFSLIALNTINAFISICDNLIIGFLHCKLDISYNQL